MSVEAPRAVDLAVVDAPEDLAPAIDTFHGRAAGIEAFKLLGGARHTRKATQVAFLLDAHRQPVVTCPIAGGIAGTSPALMPRGAAILEGAASRLATDV